MIQDRMKFMYNTVPCVAGKYSALLCEYVDVKSVVEVFVQLGGLRYSYDSGSC